LLAIASPPARRHRRLAVKLKRATVLDGAEIDRIVFRG
jgi:hypothetical protein